jgi:hypothetical protein
MMTRSWWLRTITTDLLVYELEQPIKKHKLAVYSIDRLLTEEGSVLDY